MRGGTVVRVSRCPTRTSELVDTYEARSEDERADLDRIQDLVAGGDPWDRSTAFHLTGSALVVHPETATVLLRWHERLQSWLQVGGHGDPGEHDPLMVALREAREETGLGDVAPWQGNSSPIHVVCVPVPAKGSDPAHEHADVRFLLATDQPERVVPEADDAPLRWLTFDEALAATSLENLRVTLRRAQRAVEC